jgi:hypothetical protein
MNKVIFLISILLTLSACNEAQIERICAPTHTRQFNVIYNAHFKGQIQLDLSASCDTARVYFTETPATVVLPGSFITFEVAKELQYLVETTCTDSTLTYRYINQCQ